MSLQQSDPIDGQGMKVENGNTKMDILQEQHLFHQENKNEQVISEIKATMTGLEKMDQEATMNGLEIKVMGQEATMNGLEIKVMDQEATMTGLEIKVMGQEATMTGLEIKRMDQEPPGKAMISEIKRMDQMDQEAKRVLDHYLSLDQPRLTEECKDFIIEHVDLFLEPLVQARGTLVQGPVWEERCHSLNEDGLENCLSTLSLEDREKKSFNVSQLLCMESEFVKRIESSLIPNLFRIFTIQSQGNFMYCI